MTKRIPGGRSGKEHKARRKVVPPAVKAQPAADEDKAALAAEIEAPSPVQARPVASRAPAASATQPARQSILASVRRPAKTPPLSVSTDYTYVLHDLRRIGILAGAGFAILAALTFIIR